MRTSRYLLALTFIALGCGTGNQSGAPTIPPTASMPFTPPPATATSEASLPIVTSGPTPAPASPTATTIPPSTATPEPSSTPAGVAELPLIRERAVGIPINAGTYVTSTPDGFFPGMMLTLPDGWAAKETDSGELALTNSAFPDDVLLMWKDLEATVTNNRDGKVGQPLEGIGTSAAEIVDWLKHLSDVKILSKPETVSVGDGTTGTQLTLTTSDTANFDWDDCPVNPRCVSLFTDRPHWGPGGFYAIGGDEVARIFVSTVPFPDADHTFYVTLDAVNEHDLEGFAQAAQPIIDSLVLPTTYLGN